MKSVCILGSTGTIGRLTCDVIAAHADQFTVDCLAAGRGVDRLAEQILRFHPRLAVLAREEDVPRLREHLKGRIAVEIDAGEAAYRRAAGMGCDVVVNALVGARGLLPSLAALDAGSLLALANKESLVVGGELLARACTEGRVVPIDSEHSGLLQCLQGVPIEDVQRVVLTASGGAFRTWTRERMAEATAADALRHPTWKMGPRITVDSATLLNKGFEIHEARWLFGIDEARIDVLIHPQSIVHALVEMTDGSWIAQFSSTDMRLPIQYALSHPGRLPAAGARCDLARVGELRFEEVDTGKYPCIGLARDALRRGGTSPAVLNAADEVLVAAFLDGSIGFWRIATLLERVLAEHDTHPADGVDAVLAADAWARDRALALVQESAM